VLAVPLCAYTTWFAFAGRTGLRATGDSFGVRVFLNVPRFAVTNLADNLGRTAGRAQLGPFLAIGVAVWVVWCGRRLFSSHPAVLGGVVAAVVFCALAATGRDRISPTLTPSRYAYVGVAFLLPALALMATSLRDLSWRRQPAKGAPGRSWVKGPMGVVPALVLLVIAATVGNAIDGARFARGRTDYVRGLENQIITSAALLQYPSQMARAGNLYPIWASGSASGYLTPRVLAGLYRHRLLPSASASLTGSPVEMLNDESWLDVTGAPTRSLPGAFEVLGSIGLTWSEVRTARLPARAGAEQGAAELLGALRDPELGTGRGSVEDRSAGERPTWPRGPGSCARAIPSHGNFPGAFPTSVRLHLASGAASGAVWISLGRSTGKVLALLARPWGLEGLPGSVALQGQAINIPAGGHVWVSDRAGGDDLVLQVPAGRAIELCGLAAAGGGEA
jgi:hypothetical protein